VVAAAVAVVVMVAAKLEGIRDMEKKLSKPESEKGLNRTIRQSCLIFLALVLTMSAGVQSTYAGANIKLPEKGVLSIIFESQFYLETIDTGSGPDMDESTSDMYFRRNRLSLIGRVNDKVGFNYAIEHQGNRSITETGVDGNIINRFTVLDSYVRLNLTDAFKLRVGLQKDPLVREHNEGCFFPLSIDRSYYVYTSLPRKSRDFGIMAWGNLWQNKIQYKASIMEGIEDQDAPGSSFRYTGRLHLSLLSPESLPLYFGTYLGRKKTLTIGAGYQMESDAAYGNQTLKTLPKDYSAVTYDIYAEYPFEEMGTLTLSAAFLETDFDNAYFGADPSASTTGIDGEKNGYYVKGGYLLPWKLGTGRLQAFVRNEKWNFAQFEGINGQVINWTGVGFNYYLRGHGLRVTLEYDMTDYEKESSGVVDFNSVKTMLQFRL